MDVSRENRTLINSSNLFVFFYKWRKIIMVVTALAAVSSSVVALLIPEKFKSTVILFPAQTASISKSLLSQHAPPSGDFLQFGEEVDMERMLQVLNSEEIRNKIVEKYKLAEHYGIESDNPYKRTLLKREYENNIQFKKTELMSVKIEVLDRDPQMASNIANDIASLYDSVMVRIRRERAIDAFRIVEEEYNELLEEIKNKEDSLNKLMRMGVNDYESQAERLNEALGKAIVEGRVQAAKELEEKIKTLSAYGMAYLSLRDNLYRLREQSNLLREKFQQARVDAEQNISEKFVVDRASPAEKKSYPVRWLIVTVSTLSALLLTLLGIAFVENFFRFKKQFSKPLAENEKS